MQARKRKHTPANTRSFFPFNAANNAHVSAFFSFHLPLGSL
jgi:hypothetical protein